MELNFEKYAQEGNSAVLVLQKGKSIDMYLRFFALRKKLPPESIRNGTDFYKALNGLILDQA